MLIFYTLCLLIVTSAAVIEECGAIPDLEDKEGETCLHKASLNGHLSILQYLLPDRADVHCRDADGWTALHNACSKVRSVCQDYELLPDSIVIRVILTSFDGYAKRHWPPPTSMVFPASTFGVKAVGHR